MGKRKPTLAWAILQRFLWAAALTLGVVMFALLILTDFINLNAHRRSLADELRNIESIDPDTSSSLGIYSRGSRDRVGFLLVDEHGRWTREPAQSGNTHRKPSVSYWKEAPKVLAAGELEGRGVLPWEPDPVIWAARKITLPEAGGQPMILVSWRRISAVRSANSAPYGAVVIAIMLAFLISATIALRTTRRVTHVIDAIAESSSRMAAGDFQVRLPTQPTSELDRVSSAITHLASDLDHATGELRAEQERLERLERLQRQFVADASHELRAPLTAMRVTLEAWQDGVVRPDEQPQALERLLAETERLGTLVTRLLDLSRIESGREPVEIVPTSVADVTARIVQAFNTQQGARVISEVPEEQISVLADQDALYRILHNLVENARHHTPDDGLIRIWCRIEHRHMLIAVTDTGSGIAPEDLPRIWNRFARAAEARARGTIGSGLGLAIVKGLADVMNGEVGAESVPQQGTTIWLRLPAATKELLKV